MATFDHVRHAFDGFLAADPTFSAQLAVLVGDDRVIDLHHGMGADSLLPVYSSSKGASAVVISLLVERGDLDLDATVAAYWPEFQQRGKGAVTVRQLLSHQAGLSGVDGGFTWEELLAHAPLVERLAAQRPLWQPGQGARYHALTMGTLADELVRRIDGRPLADVLHEDVTRPRAIDLWMGTPASEDARVLETQAPTREEFSAFLGDPERARLLVGDPDGLGALSIPAGGVLELAMKVNDVAHRRVGPPAAGVLASARGLATLYACLTHDVAGQPRLLSDETIGQMSQIQFAGVELGTGLPVRFGVIFQVPCPPRWSFGSFRAFGHDGLGGSLAFYDPTYDVAFGYTVQRIPLPGGMDARAVELARLVRESL
jgi:CubicO group peptidase (beta-lactamase class C family)